MKDDGRMKAGESHGTLGISKGPMIVHSGREEINYYRIDKIVKIKIYIIIENLNISLRK